MKAAFKGFTRFRLAHRTVLSQSAKSISTAGGNGYEEGRKWNSAQNIAISSAAATWLAYEVYERNKNRVFLKEAKNDEVAIEPGKFVDGLPSYTLDEVAKHASVETRIWVTFKQGVYDITKFVTEHPGGEQILLAAGSSVEPFWMLYGVHKSNFVYEILESMRIGNLSEEDAKEAIKDMSDPYHNDPKRHKILKPASVKPFNAEPPSSILVDNFITPNDLFYVRNHLPVPEIDPETYELEIEFEGKTKTVILSLDDIKKFPKHTVTMSIMCAGNRRTEMTKIKAVKGLGWGNAAIGNAQWTGAKLRDVLTAAGYDVDSDEYKHIHFEGLDTDPTSKPYGASIPSWKGVDKRGEVILAYEMNGVPIPRDHGYPIRAIVPGVVGARNVKWLGRIFLSSEESDSHWQQNDYKGFSPSTDWDTVDFTKSPAIQELPVISSICKPIANQTVTVVDGHITVQGYAWSGGGMKIVRVDVTADGGDTWHVATFDGQDSNDPPQHWAWTLWTAKIPIPDGTENVELWAKAVDSNYNTQPESFKNIWNLRGVLSNAYHRVPINLQREK
ncbi:PREDICTED: probable sulfite oxidase, mitochondrial [Nicrophorus vespilloides]|uniref:sulfite oxidase n=1 Tax=Nicrophorus vespilloides TaxID=110193 RepID=A0ABM1N2K8_NICVS|nr:PREDICTED: probable sulfite oxidase, mitochondrial [Nicrophorus vespilloides]